MIMKDYAVNLRKELIEEVIDRIKLEKSVLSAIVPRNKEVEYEFICFRKHGCC